VPRQTHEYFSANEARNLVADKRKKHVQNSNFHCRFLANADFKPLFMRLAWVLGTEIYFPSL